MAREGIQGGVWEGQEEKGAFARKVCIRGLSSCYCASSTDHFDASVDHLEYNHNYSSVRLYSGSGPHHVSNSKKVS